VGRGGVRLREVPGSRRVAIAVIVPLTIAALVGWVWLRPGSRSARGRGVVASGGSAHGRSRGSTTTGAAPHAWLAQRDVGARRVAGRVVTDGKAVAGATVMLASRASDYGLVGVRRVTTGADGAFDFGAQDAATATVAAEAPGKTGAMTRIDLRDPTLRPAPDALVLELRPCVASVVGNVFDAAGGAIPGAVVRRGVLEAVADADGAYTMCVPIGETTLDVAADGYGGVTVTLAVTGKLRRDFQLSPEGVLVGRAVRADDKTPVAGAIVAVATSGEPFPGMAGIGSAVGKATTDDDGRFRVEGLVPGRRQVSATAAGLRMSSMDVVVEAGEAGEPVELALGPTASIRGVVVDERKQPVAGATVAIRDPNPTWSSRGDNVTGVTQADGRFTIDGVLAGAYETSVWPYERRDRTTRRELVVPASGLDGVELVVERGSTVNGVVTLGHRPLAGARVYLKGAFSDQSESDAEGRFRIRAVEPGDYPIYAEAIQDGAFTNGPSVHVEAGSDVNGITLELDLAGTISGVVVDQRGAPVPGAYLSVSLVDGQDFGEATTGDDGAFKIGALSGGGDYAVRIMASKQSRQRYEPATGRPFPRVAVADGSSHVDGVRFAVKIERLQIAGRVVDDQGKPVPDARVDAHVDDEPYFGGGAPSAVTDADGAFAIADLLAGSYALSARAGNGAETDSAAAIPAGTRDVRLVLAAPGEIEGTLVGFTGTPRVVAHPFNEHARRLSELNAEVHGTTFRIRGVPAGPCMITASSGGVKGDETYVEVKPRATAKVTLTYRGVGSIGGVVVDGETQAPVEGVRCFGAGARNVRDEASSDAQGRFTIDPAPVGATFVMCQSRDGKFGHAQITVAVGQRSAVTVSLQDPPTRPSE
jgi:protocatechuate 3,4-dioxygenase beta subunit